MALKLSQELKLTQKLSPLQIQTIKLIELPVQELQEKIRKELEENPVLDEDEVEKEQNEDTEGEPRQVSLSEYKEDDSIPSYKLYVNNQGRDPLPEYSTFSVKESFTQSLMDQLGFRNLDEHQRSVAAFIIGSLDDDGYLRRDIESLVDDMAFRAGVETTEEEVEQMLAVIQDFDPAGVGARDLQECLLLQLKGHVHTIDDRHAQTILTDYFDEFKAKHFQHIMRRMGLSQEEMRGAIARIVRLNPSPGGQVDDSYNDRAQQIIPDFNIDLVDGEPVVNMPRFNIPDLKVSRKYASLIQEAATTHDKGTKEAAAFVKQKMDQAKWFVEAVKQRQNTLMTTMQAIVDYQKEFFIEGDESLLKPMVLKDIAAVTGFDISTISRVVNSKYVETHFGVYPLKYFFSEGLADQDGNEVSSRELKHALRQLVDNEDKSKPLTDDELVELMTARGYRLARRTIAKYRDQLKIPKARLRKELV